MRLAGHPHPFCLAVLLAEYQSCWEQVRGKGTFEVLPHAELQKAVCCLMQRAVEDIKGKMGC